MKIAHLFTKLDYLCDFIPLLSSVTNLIDIFQKCVILPHLEKSNIENNHYYKHLNHKAYKRCLLALIPIVGNIYIGFLDYNHRAFNSRLSTPLNNNNLNQYARNAQTLRSWQALDQSSHHQIELKDVDRIHVDPICNERMPCIHEAFVYLKDGRSVCLDSVKAYPLISHFSAEKINPDDKWDGKSVKEHFEIYANFYSRRSAPGNVLKELSFI